MRLVRSLIKCTVLNLRSRAALTIECNSFMVWKKLYPYPKKVQPQKEHPVNSCVPKATLPFIFRPSSHIFLLYLQAFKSRIDEMRVAIQKNRQRKPFPSPLIPPSATSRSKKVKVRRKSDEKGGNGNTSQQPESSKTALLVTTQDLGSSTPVWKENLIVYVSTDAKELL